MQKESLHDEWERRNEKRKFRARQLALQNVLLETLAYIAVRDEGKDALEAVEVDPAIVEDESKPWSAARDYRRLKNCHSEWIGYAPKCCNSAAIAIPCNCNHRLCMLCNSARLEQYRAKAREMLDSMKNPCFLTLTVPNQAELSKATYQVIRAQWKEFRKDNPIVGTGGVYSIETTYNRETCEWHVHIHVVFDSPFPLSLPRRQFTLLKRRLELRWLMASDPSAKFRIPIPKAWRIKEKGKRSRMANLAERKEQQFQDWNMALKSHPRGDPWNVENRRVIDIRKVKGGDGAVYEVIKYISKTNRFLDIPDAVEGYLRAVRGVRIIQPYGTCYRFKFDEAVEAQTYMKCDCGKHDFERVGVFSLTSVYQAESGCWYLKRQHQQRRGCRGGPE